MGLRLLVPCLCLIVAVAACGEKGTKSQGQPADSKQNAPDAPEHDASTANATYEEALQIFCDAARLPELATMPPGERALRFAKHVEDHAGAKSSERLSASLVATSPEGQRALLEEALDKAKVTNCAALPFLFPPPQEGECLSQADCSLRCPANTSQKAIRVVVERGRAQACVKADGQWHGPFVEWHAGGTLARRGSYKNGKQDGPWTVWFDTGQKRQAGSFRNGVPDGPWTYWHLFGVKSEQVTFVGGKKNGPATVWDVQDKKRTVVYKDNKIVPQAGQ